MPLGEIILATIVDAVFSNVVDKGADKLGIWARDKRGVTSTKKAFQEALNKAFEQLERQHPTWVDEQFNASFFQREGAPTLAQFLVRDGHPDPNELATRWADSLNIQQPEKRIIYIRKLEPVAADFLDALAHQLKSKEELRELHDSRIFEQLAIDLRAIRERMGAGEATTNTRRDYLRWLIERNFYLDPRGTFQTQSQVQVKLDEVYISLRAQREDTLGIADRYSLEKELTDLETKVITSKLSLEEAEDRREQLLARSENRLTTGTPGPGEVLELAEAVTRYDRLVILGDPGSGKSTLLRYLALKHAEASWNGQTEVEADLGVARFPILIHVAEYAEESIWKKQSLSDFLPDSYIIHECPRDGLEDLLQLELADGNCLVLLDGLDEIVGADERRGIVQRIEDFVRRHDNKANRFVITSRNAGYRSAPLGEPFTHFTVQEMDEKQIYRFLERWCQAVEDVQTPEISLQERRNVARREIDGIMKAVQTSPGVRRLAANPLLLRILALIRRTAAQIPQKRIELYKLASDTLARTWRTTQGVPESALIKDGYLTPMLSKLAYWLHVNKPTSIATEREVYDVLGEEWARLNDLRWDADDPNPQIIEEVRKFLLAVSEHTGLFVERAPKRYSFMHLTFEEYYVARYLVAHSKSRAKLIRQHLHDPRWGEPILLALGFLGLEYPSEASELVEIAILAEGEDANLLGFTPSSYEDLLGRDYLFALRCISDNIPIRPRLLKRLIARLANELLYETGSTRFQSYRRALVERLQYLASSAGAFALLPLLINALGDASSKVRFAAAGNLGQLGQFTPEVIFALIATLHDADSYVRFAAAGSLGRSGKTSPEVINTLTAALSDISSNVRSAAAGSLGRLGKASPEVITALISTLGDVNFYVRFTGAGSLGQLDQPTSEVISALVTACGDPDTNLRSAASLSLGQLSQISSEVVAALISSLSDTSPHIRAGVARSLRLLNQPTSEVIAALTIALCDTSPNVRSAAVRSLGYLAQLGQPTLEVVSTLIAACSDASPNVRAGAVESLGRLGKASSEVITALISALGDVNSFVRLTAAGSLGQLGQPTLEVVSTLITACGDAYPNVRAAAVESLGRLGQLSSSITEIISALTTALEDTAYNVCFAGARSLGQLNQDSSEVISALVTALHIPDALVCSAAALSLKQLGQALPEVRSVLLEALGKEEKGSILGDAVRLLGQVGLNDATTIEKLWRGLLNNDNEIRTACAQALAQLGKRIPSAAEEITAKLVQAIREQEFEETDSYENRTGHDYAYDGLWLLVVGEEIK